MPYNKEAAGIPTEVIAEMYIGQGKSLLEVANHWGVSSSFIRDRLHRGGYKVRPKGIQLTSRLGRNDPKLAATRSPESVEIGWAAGLYEGEGSCSVRSHDNGKHGMQILVCQKERWVCDRLREMFGGSVSHYNHHRNSLRPYPTNMHVWRATCSRAMGFAMTIYRFLSPHRQERIRQALKHERERHHRRAEIIAAAQ